MEKYIDKLEQGYTKSLIKDFTDPESWYDPNYPDAPSQYDYPQIVVHAFNEGDNVFKDIETLEDEVLCHFYHPAYKVVKIKIEVYYLYRYPGNTYSKVILKRKELYALRNKNWDHFMLSNKILREILL
jgi:hypothetical protein